MWWIATRRIDAPTAIRSRIPAGNRQAQFQVLAAARDRITSVQGGFPLRRFAASRLETPCATVFVMISRIVFVWLLLLMGIRLSAAEPEMGRSIYLRACAICHGEEGEGWREKNGPTLRQTDWVTGDPERLIRITLSGLYLRIPLKNGTHYGSMPGHRDQLNDGEIAAVLTYIRQTWGNQAPTISATQVEALRPEAHARLWPWKASDFGLEAKPVLGRNGEALEPPDPFAAAGFKVYRLVSRTCG